MEPDREECVLLLWDIWRSCSYLYDSGQHYLLSRAATVAEHFLRFLAHVYQDPIITIPRSGEFTFLWLDNEASYMAMLVFNGGGGEIEFKWCYRTDPTESGQLEFWIEDDGIPPEVLKRIPRRPADV